VAWCQLDPAFDDLIVQFPEQAHRSWARMQEAIVRDGIMFGSDPLPACLKPHFIAAKTHARWVERSEALCSLMEAVGRLFLREDDLFAQLGLPAAAADLLKIDPGYQRLAVICRPDCIWNGDDFFVIENNSDSPAMMTFVDYLDGLMAKLFPAVQLTDEERLPANRTAVLHQALIDCYREWGGRDSPTIAIVDWDNVKTIHEQRRTAREFELLGTDCVTCDPRELAIDHGKLVANGRKIDIVYRRVLFNDFITRAPELKPLFTAYRDGLTCMVNPLRSFIPGNKMMLAMLHDPEILEHLGAANRAIAGEVIAKSVRLHGANAEMVRRTRAHWVMKGAFGYGGKEVIIGRDCTQAEWDAAIAGKQGEWIAQEFVSPPQLKVPVFKDGAISWEIRCANWSPWLFGGRFAGGMTRMSSETIVSITQQGALIPSVPEEERVAVENRIAL
jgi:uncharacterized circularly permuted ATP-grasp superfamily protein